MIMTEKVDDNAIPPLPEKWDRCHAYNKRKSKYCKQMPLPLSGKCSNTTNQPRYCGHHRHLIVEECNDNNYICEVVDLLFVVCW